MSAAAEHLIDWLARDGRRTVTSLWAARVCDLTLEEAERVMLELWDLGLMRTAFGETRPRPGLEYPLDRERVAELAGGQERATVALEPHVRARLSPLAARP